MRSRRLLLAPLLLAALGPLAVGCTSGSDGARAADSVVPPAPKAEVRSIDWRAASYSLNCPGLGGPAGEQVPVTMADGAGTTAPVSWFGPPTALEIAVDSVEFGDLTGDGREEAVVRLTCTPEQSNGVADEIQVFGPGAELLAKPVVPNRGASDFAPSIRTLQIRDGRLTGTAYQWAADDPHCCPSQTLPFTFSWNAASTAFDAA